LVVVVVLLKTVPWKAPPVASKTFPWKVLGAVPVWIIPGSVKKASARAETARVKVAARVRK
jgi:hypothetical protein